MVSFSYHSIRHIQSYQQEGKVVFEGEGYQFLLELVTKYIRLKYTTI